MVVTPATKRTGPLLQLPDSWTDEGTSGNDEDTSGSSEVENRNEAEGEDGDDHPESLNRKEAITDDGEYGDDDELSYEDGEEL